MIKGAWKCIPVICKQNLNIRQIRTTVLPKYFVTKQFLRSRLVRFVFNYVQMQLNFVVSSD